MPEPTAVPDTERSRPRGLIERVREAIGDARNRGALRNR